MFIHNKKAPTLDPDFLLVAYCNGYFPMATSRTGHIEWFSPDPRAIIPLDKFKISRSLKQKVHKKFFEIRIDTAFESVMRACASREDTWISEEIISVYTELHRRGFAHSVETWHDGKLVGGLYGVAIRGAFFGESMFSRMTDASKVAIVHLVERMKQRSLTLLDAQYMTEHLRVFGTIEIPRSSYLQLLSRALDVHTTFVEKG
ncbi:MAG: leucyl/phenylalanyl-tRNA--protein transferase [Bacteroidota bacterium]|jgi:leucyl/phenylalanyl-tRNA--protein transferase